MGKKEEIPKKEEKSRNIKRKEKKEEKESQLNNKEEIKEIKKEIKEEFEKVEKEIEEESEKISNSIWFVGIVALLVGLIVGLIVGGFVNITKTNEKVSNNIGNNIKSMNINEIKINKEEIKKKVENTLKKIIFEQAGLEIKPKVVDYKDEGSFYNVTVQLPLQNGMKQKINVFLSKDGNYMFVGAAVKTVEKVGNLCEIKKKSDKPKVIVAVMANCPFGNQIEPVVKEIIDLFGDKIEVEPRYIFYRGKNPYGESTEANNKSYWSLHGNYELEEGLFELAVWKLYGTKTWIELVVKVNNQCYKRANTVKSVRKCAEKIAKEMNLDVNKIENYLKENRNKLIEKEAELTTDKQILGSPTIIINGEVYRCPRTAEALKKAICSAFINPPAECNQQLSNKETAPTGSCG